MEKVIFDLTQKGELITDHLKNVDEDFFHAANRFRRDVLADITKKMMFQQGYRTTNAMADIQKAIPEGTLTHSLLFLLLMREELESIEKDILDTFKKGMEVRKQELD